ncbi:MAG: acyl-CoA thioesterase [Deltaproteobacteria bacterium]|nr:acyl-CoA thioesterase [Deltaproteobacteria bacterium]
MEHVADVRVLYADTDAAGVAYYANYFRWFETGRAELMRQKGTAYRDLTEAGMLLPVVEASIRYRSPARYDDVIKVYAEVREMRGARITFGYRLTRSDGKLLAEGATLHAFTDDRGKVVRAPANLTMNTRLVDKSAEEGR